MSAEEARTIVIDNGSETTRIGYAGDITPTSILPSVVGKPKFIYQIGTDAEKDIFIGDDAISKSQSLAITRPLEFCEIVNWDDLETIWNQIFYKILQVDPKGRDILLTKSSISTTSSEKAGEIMFETFDVRGLFVGVQETLALYGSGRTTGIVIDSGLDVTRVVPVYAGTALKHAQQSSKIGGRTLNEYLKKILSERCCDIDDTNQIRCIKEKMCYVAYEFNSEMTKSQTTSDIDASYESITLSSERFRCPELLFRPHFNGFECDGVDEMVSNAVEKCDSDLHADLLGNVILSGGSMMFSGMSERLEKGLRKQVPAEVTVKVSGKDDRTFSVWCGGSVLATMAAFPQMLVTKDEYTEVGKQVMDIKCF